MAKDSPPVDYKAISKEELLRRLMEHQAVIEEVVKVCTAVPIKFGATAGDDHEIIGILETGYPSFRKALDEADGKVGVEVIARWKDLNPILKDIGEKSEIKRFKEGIDKKDIGEYKRMAVELGRMVKTALGQENARIRDEIVEPLKGHALDMRLHDVLDDSMIMNAAFLIPKNPSTTVGEEPLLFPPLQGEGQGGDGVNKGFSEQLEKIIERYRDRIDFKIIGPLPPYSFSTLEIKKVGREEVERSMRVMGLDGGGEEEVREAYRKLLQRYHPDKNQGDPDAQDRFESIRLAYNTLSGLTSLSNERDAFIVRAA